jgi:hypothetical protein
VLVKVLKVATAPLAALLVIVGLLYFVPAFVGPDACRQVASTGLATARQLYLANRVCMAETETVLYDVDLLVHEWLDAENRQQVERALDHYDIEIRKTGAGGFEIELREKVASEAADMDYGGYRVGWYGTGAEDNGLIFHVDRACEKDP